MENTQNKLALFIFIGVTLFTALNSNIFPAESEEVASCPTCPTLSPSDFNVADLGHKIIVSFSSQDYQPSSWESNNPSETTLLVDKGSNAEFLDSGGNGYIEVKVTYDDESCSCNVAEDCVATKLLYY